MGQVLVLKDVVDGLKSTLDKIVRVLDAQCQRFSDETSQHVADGHIHGASELLLKVVLKELVEGEINESAGSRPVEAR